MDEPMLPDRYLNPPISMDWIDILGKKIMLLGDKHTKPTPQNTPQIDIRWTDQVKTESIKQICENISSKIQSKGVLNVYLEDSLHTKFDNMDDITMFAVRKQLYELQSEERIKSRRSCYVHRVDIRTIQDYAYDSGLGYFSYLFYFGYAFGLNRYQITTIERTLLKVGDAESFSKSLFEFLFDDNPIDEDMIGRDKDRALFDTLRRFDEAYETLKQSIEKNPTTSLFDSHLKSKIKIMTKMYNYHLNAKKQIEKLTIQIHIERTYRGRVSLSGLHLITLKAILRKRFEKSALSASQKLLIKRYYLDNNSRFSTWDRDFRLFQFNHCLIEIYTLLRMFTTYSRRELEDTDPTYILVYMGQYHTDQLYNLLLLLGGNFYHRHKTLNVLTVLDFKDSVMSLNSTTIPRFPSIIWLYNCSYAQFYFTKYRDSELTPSTPFIFS